METKFYRVEIYHCYDVGLTLFFDSLGASTNAPTKK